MYSCGQIKIIFLILILQKNILKKKYFIYKSYKILKKKTTNHSINELNIYKKFIEGKKNVFFKNYYYFKKRYLSYRKNDYFINKFIFRNKTSFFIIKRNRDKSGYSNVILDHFGSKKFITNICQILLKI